MQTYEKPKDVRFTDMCIWVDAHKLDRDVDVDTLYKYLYLIAIMRARQNKMFVQDTDYDNFALYCATRAYFRLTNKKQFEYDDNGEPLVKPIKSILNWYDKVLPYIKADFLLEHGLSPNDATRVIFAGDFDLGEIIADDTYMFDRLDYSFTFDGIASAARAHLKRIPVKYGSAEWTNIYISCLLTLIDSISPSAYQLSRVVDNTSDEFYDRVYKDCRYNSPVLYHLDNSYSNYITILVNEIRHVLASELSYETETFIPSDDAMKGLFHAALEGAGEDY